MKKILVWFCTVVIAVVVGVGSTVWILKRHAEASWLANGRWLINTSAGSTAEGFYPKATVAMGGLLALNPKETLYYVTSFDDEGNKLNARCNYRVQGTDLDTRWWSMTVYGGDFMLIDTPQQVYSANQQSVTRNADGGWAVAISPKKTGENWVPSGGADEQLYLLMRLYHPGKSVYDNPSQAKLPTVTRVSCP